MAKRIEIIFTENDQIVNFEGSPIHIIADLTAMLLQDERVYKMFKIAMDTAEMMLDAREENRAKKQKEDPEPEPQTKQGDE